jgi:hypothetical protein
VLLADELRRSAVGWRTPGAMKEANPAAPVPDGVRTAAAALARYEAAALARSAVKVEKSRAAGALLHSEAATTKGDLTRAGTALSIRQAAEARAEAGSAEAAAVGSPQRPPT